MPCEKDPSECTIKRGMIFYVTIGILAASISAEIPFIVVALIGDEATVKTFYKEKDHIRLQPENSTMDPIIVPNCKILGKVAGVFRKM